METKWYEVYKGHVIEYVQFIKKYRVRELYIPITSFWADTKEEAKKILDNKHEGDEENEKNKN